MKAEATLNKTEQCERTYATGSSSLAQRWLSRLSFTSISAVIRGVVAGPAVKAAWLALTRATSNNRTYAALLLILVFAPLSGVAYLLFDQTVKETDWYYRNYFYLFYMLSPHIHMTLTLTGVFLLFPESRKGFFLIVPITYHVAKIMWLPTVTTNQELNSWIPGAFWLTAILTAAVWLFLFNYLMSLHYHKRAGSYARAEGILLVRGIDNETKIALALEEIKKAKSI